MNSTASASPSGVAVCAASATYAPSFTSSRASGSAATSSIGASASNPRNTPDIERGVLVLLGVAILLAILYWGQQSRINKALRAQSGQSVDFTSAGITTISPTGTTTFEPWSAFTSFREGQHLILLKPQTKAPIRAIPIGEIPPAERGQLRSMLLSNLPEAF